MGNKKGKKVAIVSLGYAWFPCEPGPSRFYYIAKLFAERGYDVDLVCSGFQHFEKKMRDKGLILRQGYPFHITFIDVPSYRKNIDIRRVYSNKVAARNVVRHIRSGNYDMVYCSIPANDVAAAVARHCHKNGIPLVIDIEDLWPEAMDMAVKSKILRMLVYPYFLRDAETAYRYANAVVGTSDEYTERAVKHRDSRLLRKTVYVGCDIRIFDEGVKKYAGTIKKQADEFWVTYAGSIGSSYDIHTLVLAGRELEERGMGNVRVKILGTGVLQKELEELARQEECRNVEFLGYKAYPEMAAYLYRSDVLINSFVKGAPQSIVNKVGDYLAAGKPVINTLQSPEFMEMLEREDIGMNIEPEDVGKLTDAVCIYMSDQAICTRQGLHARETAEKYFDRARTYMEMAELAEELMKRKSWIGKK